MSQLTTPRPATGLPPGVETGPLGKRLVAQLIDLSVPLVVGIIASAVVGQSAGSGTATAVSVVAWLLVVAWSVVVWWMFATRAAGPGMRAMKLQLVGLRNGRPIGWGRYLVRSLVLAGLAVTVIGLVLLLVFLVRHPRKQGLHDLVAESVVIKQRMLATPKRTAAPAEASQPAPAQQARRATPPAGPRPADAAPTAGPTASRSTRPGSTAPGSTRPGSTAPGSTRPGSSGPRSTGPASTAPGTTAPGTTAPGTTAPGTGPSPRDGSAPAVPDEKAGTAPASAAPGAAPGQDARPLTAPDGRKPAGAHAVAPRAPAEDSVRLRPRRSSGVEPPPAAPDVTPTVHDGRPLDQGWVAVLDDGRDVPITGLVMLGRSPQARAGEDDAELVKVADDTRTVSKTHLSLKVDASGLFVMDRGSTNGTTLTNVVGVSKPCPAGDIVPVSEGAIVSFGDHWLKIERRFDR